MSKLQEVFDLDRFSKEFDISGNKFLNLIQRYGQPHRFYHNFKHVKSLLDQIKDLSKLDSDQKYILGIVALFHDVVYSPFRDDNEEMSVAYFNKFVKEEPSVANEVRQIILDTKTHQPSTELSKVFCILDTKILRSKSLAELLQWEDSIFKEYQSYPLPMYKTKRIQFLEKHYDQNPTLKDLAECISTKVYKFGLYPGSFDPFHLGHLNILQKAENLNFDKVVVALGKNPDKDHSNFEEGIKTVRGQLGFRRVVGYESLLVDFLEIFDNDITVVRGLRSGNDLSYEMNQLRVLEDLSNNRDLKTVMIIGSREYSHISSSMVRGLSKFENDDHLNYLPAKYVF